MGKRKWLVLAVVIGIPIVLLTQCSVGSLFPILIGKKIWLNDNPSLFQKEVRRHVIDRSIADAKGYMELNGFTCEPGEGFKPNNPAEQKESKAGSDYLSCYTHHSPLVFCTEFYEPYLFYKEGIVTGVVAYVEVWCL